MPELNRPPRIQPELPSGEVTIPNPPGAEGGGRQNLVQVALPMLTIIAYVLVGSQGGGRSILFVIPMGISIVATTALAIWTFFRTAKREAEKLEAFKLRLTDLRAQMNSDHDKQRAFYHYNYPDPESALHLAGGQNDGRPSTRLWERRASDSDFGSVRLGIGVMPSTVQYKAQSADNSDSPLTPDVLKLADDSRYVTEVPVIIPLRPHFKEGSQEPATLARHAIGIAGKDRNKVSDFVRTIALHLSAFHTPTEARLFVVGSSESKAAWSWARWLPHCNASRNESSAGDQLAFEPRKARRIWDNLQSELERRQLRLADKDNQSDVTVPFLLVILDALGVPKGADSPLKDVETEAAISILLQNGPELGAAVMFLVPEVSMVPSECKAVIEVEPANEALAFRYAEVGVNSTRYDGAADTIDAKRAEQDFARKLAPLAVRATYGADLAMAVSLLELNHAEAVDQLPILDQWRESRLPEKAEWLRVPIGLLVGNKIRELVFSADGDGVHGMIAGTTGSGKSELLLTLIVGLGIRYDPSIINFVLVDYKGGAAFEPFRKMPHTVDIVTNLQGMAGARTFTALRAELNRRSKIIADSNTKHVVHYRQKNLHVTREPFPHLFVIIDEFAEMVKEMPEFRAQLDSITRLGRALGVTLILATQRPAGVVTDQMRANMKFRICLRVETPEDSRELLRRSDAAFLPPNIPGRAYLQVGNENVELMQVARAGGPYTGPQADTQPPVIWLTRREKTGTQAIRTGGSGPATEAPALSDVIVGMTIRLAEENPEEVKPQRKPWPDPLPLRLPLDAVSLGPDAQPNALLPLSPAVLDWSDGEGSWKGVDWTETAMRVTVGLIDNPARAEQLPLNLDLTRGHCVIFGASGWGKTTFLRTVVTALATTHSPDELQMYFLDFGGRGLDVLLAFPHVGATIMPSEDERVQRLLRKIGSILEERRIVLSQARADNLSVYNANNPDKIIPAILVVIDNFAEFKENFDTQMDALISLVRDGRSYGVHFIITAEQTSAIPGKLYSLFTERLTLKLADAGEYASIVGRGVPDIAEIPGRGFIQVDRTPLELQTALPIGLTQEDEEAGIDDAKKLAQLAQTLRNTWRGKTPQGIDILRTIVPLKSVLAENTPPAKGILPILGLEDLDLKPAILDLANKGPHFLVIGPPLSGKTTTMRSLVMSLANSYRPDQVMLILIDFQQRFFRYAGAGGNHHTLGDLPHVLAAISEVEELKKAVTDLKAEYEEPKPTGWTRPEIFFISDNYDDWSRVVGSGTDPKVTAYKDLADMARKYGPEGLHFVMCGSIQATRSTDEFMRQVMAPRYGFGLDATDAPQALGGRVRSGAATELPPGRGFIVKSGRSSLIQVATPQNENNVEESLDAWVDEIIARHPKRATWSRDKLSPAPVAQLENQPAK